MKIHFYKKYLVSILILFVINISAFTQCWDKVFDPPVVRGFWDIDFVNDSVGWAAGVNDSDGTADTTIFAKTVDGGDTWTLSFFPEYSGSELENCCTKIDFVDEEVGYGASGINVFYKTEDGGETWSPGGEIEHDGWAGKLRGLQFINRDTGWISFEQAGLFKTVDGGETWYHPYGAGYEFEFINGQIGWSFLGGGFTQFYKTVDGGDNWELTANYQLTSSSLDFLNDTLGWVAGYYSDVVYKTIDGGETLEFIGGTSAEDRFWVSEIQFANDTLGWMTSRENHRIAITVDGGETWHLQGTYISEDTRGLFVKGSDEAWASGDVLRQYKGELPPCEYPDNFVDFSNLMLPYGAPLMPKITWDELPGCVDGYLINIAYQDTSEIFVNVDVGLNTSYQLTEPLPESSFLAIRVLAYNYVYGTGGCLYCIKIALHKKRKNCDKNKETCEASESLFRRIKAKDCKRISVWESQLWYLSRRKWLDQ